MADVKIDMISTLGMKEKWGTIVEVRRQAIVSGLTGNDWSTMYDVLDEAGVPTWGDYLDSGRGSHLALTDRVVKMVDKDKAEIDLLYEQFNDGGQRLFQETGVVVDRNVAGKMQASITQKRTNLYRENGTGDEALITVAHTYAVDDPDYAAQTITQTGEVDVSLPQRTFVIEGIKETGTPWNIAERLVGAVNDTTWLGRAEHTWMCTEVSWDFREGAYGGSPARYHMQFTFQHDSDTWDPSVVFIDDRTGRPPEDLVEDVGYKRIRYHREVNFVRELGFFVIGPSQGS